MIRSLSWLSICAALTMAAGCGDDGGGDDTDGGMTGGDAAATVMCPPDAPDRESMMGACCYREPNTGARAEAPEFRLTNVALQSPASLNSGVVHGLLRNALNRELFNWIFRIEISGTNATITTGYGQRNDDSTFSFVMGGAPAPGDPNRWDPVTAPGTIGGETVMTEPLDGSITLPIFEEDGTTLSTELPLRSLELNMATMSEERSCIGIRRPGGYQTDQGMLTAYIMVEDAKVTDVAALTTTLCNFVASVPSGGDCDTTPQSEWNIQPDSVCDDTGCSMGGCNPAADCNAWQVTSEFAAHAVEITN